MPSPLIVILWLVTLIVCDYFITIWRIRKRIPTGCLPPPEIPRIKALFGLDLFRESIKMRNQHKMLETNAKHHEIYGKTFQALRLGRTTIYTADPENIKAVFGTCWKEWGTGRANAMEPFCGPGFVTRDGEEWRIYRTLFASTLNEANAVNLHLLRQAYKQYVEELPSNGESVDLAPIFDKLFLDLSLQFLFGEGLSKLYSADSPVSMHTFENAFDTAQGWMGIRLALGRFGHGLSLFSQRWKESCKIVHSLVDYHIKKSFEKLNTSKSDSSVPSLLANLRMRGKSPVEIRSQIIQGMLVTQDTTGIVLSNTIFLLARAPEVWSRLRGEVAGIGPVEDWRSSDLKKLKLLHNCIKESLRIHPLFHANGRVATTDTTLPTGGGPNGTAPIFIPTGTRVSTNFYTLYRDKAVFGEDINSFNPDRWNYISPSSWEFMPFSHGPRSCAGRHKALGEASYIIARMAVQFERIQSRDDRPWTENVKLVVKNGNGCHVTVHPA